jgi:hypothetical protein
MSRLDYSKVDRCQRGHDLRLPGALVMEGKAGHQRQRCRECRKEKDRKRNLKRRGIDKRKPTTHCRQGHRLAGGNLMIVHHYQTGIVERRCRVCNAKRDRLRKGTEGAASLLECQAEMVRTRQLFALDVLYDRASTWWDREAIKARRRQLEVG